MTTRGEDKTATGAPGVFAGTAASARATPLHSILAEISREALQGEGLDAVLQRIVDCLVLRLQLPIASIDAATQFVQEVWAGELDLQEPALATGWPVSKGAAGRCARMGTAQLIVDVEHDPDYVAGNSAVRSEYLVPIRHRDRLHGVLNIESRLADFFTREACAVFDAVADQIAGAIHLARVARELEIANRKLQQLSMSDGLTGIANRRCFDERLAADWQRLAREGRPLALVLADADAFKPLNDACGHLYGDECLRELTRICSEVADGAEDLVARFGGEELVLLLPGRDPEQAWTIAERLRSGIESLAMAHPASAVAPWVTVSIGIGVRVPDETQAPEQLIAAADRALYRAKARGRNRVESEPPSGE